MTIGQLARAAGVGVETLRFYERKGVLDEPPRLASGYRQYPPAALERLRFIHRAPALGFKLEEIAELVGLSSDDVGSCDNVRARARARLADVEQRIADLQEMRSRLDQLVDTCDAQDDDSCPFLQGEPTTP